MYSSILVPVDLAHPEGGRKILSLAREIGGPEAKITALTVIESIPSFIAAELPEGLLARNADAAKVALGELASAVGADHHVKVGHTSTLILDFARENGFELIVVASHRPGIEDYFLGSTAARVVRRAECAVLVDR